MSKTKRIKKTYTTPLVVMDNATKALSSVGYGESNNIIEDALLFDSDLNFKVPQSAIFVMLESDTSYTANRYNSTRWGEWVYDEDLHKRVLTVTNKDMTNRIMNFVSHGHSVMFVYDGHYFPIGTPSKALILTSIKEQLDFLLSTYTYLRSGFLKRIMINRFSPITVIRTKDEDFDDYDTFIKAIGDKEVEYEVVNLTYKERETWAYKEARDYFTQRDWAEEVQSSAKYILCNNIISAALLDIEQYKEVVKAEENTQVRLAALSEFPVIKDIPNQDTLSAVSEQLNYELSFAGQQLGSKKEYTGVYIKAHHKYYVSEADALEQEVVNTYYYSIPEFRVLTEDELMAEYTKLCTEYEDLKALAGINPVKARLVAKKWAKLGRYDRYLELEVKFSTILFGQLRYIESLDKKPKAESRYDG